MLGRVLEDLDAALRRIRVLDGLIFAARGFVVVVAAVGLGVWVGGRGAEVSAWFYRHVGGEGGRGVGANRSGAWPRDRWVSRVGG